MLHDADLLVFGIKLLVHADVIVRNSIIVCFVEDRYYPYHCTISKLSLQLLLQFLTCSWKPLYLNVKFMECCFLVVQMVILAYK